MRIYKGSEITLRLYNPCKIEDGLVDVILYTTNPKLAYKIKDATVEGNIVYVRINKSTFNNMEDGVINYIILDEVYNTERQSSYYLKTPEDYVAKSVQTSKDIYIVDNGDYKVLPDEDYTSIEEVNVHVEFDAEHYYQEGYETGKAYQKSKLESVSITENGTYTREDGYNEIHVEVPDLNGDYNEGYDAGKVDGYNRGYDEGETDQKAKLTGITITENGTYSREDGYNEVVVEVPDLNGSYDEGYQAGIDYASENAEEIAAANAIDLVATEFRTYYTKYSDNIVNPNPVTGIYPDGEKFYNLANVKNNVYNTGIIPNETTKLEFWFKPDLVKDDQDGDWWSNVIDAEVNDNNCFRIRHYNPGTALSYEFSIKGNRINCDLIDGINHIEMSYADGLIVNSVKVGNFKQNISNDFNEPFYINGGNLNLYNPPSRTDDGNFGMIKITTDGITNIIIPAEDGLKNITTDEMLEVVYNEGIYQYINNDPIILDNLIKSVDVQPKINVAKYGIKLGYSTFSEIPDFYYFDGVTDTLNLFCDCNKLQTIPLIDTSKSTNMTGMFARCSSLITIPQLVTSNVTTMAEMFTGCISLTTIPPLDTSNVTEMRNLFYRCTSLTTVPPLNAGKLNIGTYYGLVGYYTLPVTDFGGLIGLKCSLNNNNTFTKLPNLNYQSCINILNGLYDFAGNGETPTSSQGQLKVHQNFLTTVGDEISIGTLKGWSISA